MLMTTDEPPGNVLAGWRDMQSTFSDALRSLRALSPSSLGAALTRCFDYLNANRMRNITDFFGNVSSPLFSSSSAVFFGNYLILHFTDISHRDAFPAGQSPLLLSCLPMANYFPLLLMLNLR